MNCSQRSEYDRNIVELKSALRSRGYPTSMMPDIPYDEERRMQILTGLAARSLRNRPSATDINTNVITNDYVKKKQRVLAFKTEYFPEIHRLGLMRQINRLIKDLRIHVGQTLLEDTKLVIGYGVRKCNDVISHISRTSCPNIIERMISEGSVLVYW